MSLRVVSVMREGKPLWQCTGGDFGRMHEDVLGYIGIDPGQNGAVAIMRRDRTFGVPIPTYWDIVTTKRGLTKRKRYDIKALRNLLTNYVNGYIVWLEEAFPMPVQGVTSMFSNGLGYGILQGLLVGLEIGFNIVHPKTWQAEYKIRKTEEKDTKEQALEKCVELFPHVNLMGSERSSTPHNGIVDALLIAEYGKRQNEKGAGI